MGRKKKCLLLIQEKRFLGRGNQELMQKSHDESVPDVFEEGVSGSGECKKRVESVGPRFRGPIK